MMMMIGALLASVAVWLLNLSAPPAAQENALPRAVVLQVDGIIGPASDNFIVRGIEDAEESGARVVILMLNTPGGLDSAMRNIISKILASSVPIVTYVAPPGSRAASAGTYIAYASHIAAMAPTTNLGSATPVNLSPGGIGDDGKPTGDDGDGDKQSADKGDEVGFPKLDTAMQRKMVNDAVAYIKGLARLRGRNEQWAEEAVRAAVNLTAEDALEQNVIDVVAADVPALLQAIDGRTVELQSGTVVLDTQGIEVQLIEPDWRTRFLDVITHPNVAYIFMFLGIYGLFFELSNPGSILPGVLGAIALLLALYAFQILPVNYAGLALIVVGIAFMVGEMFVPSFGVLGIGGAAAMVFGSLILMETEVEALQISLPLIGAVTVVTGLFIFALASLAIRQRGRPIVSGREEMLAAVGQVSEDFDDEGFILIHGERWAARTTVPLHKGQPVRVRDLDGLVLVVEPDEEN